MLASTGHDPKQDPGLVKLYPMLLKPLACRAGKARGSHIDPSPKFQTQDTPNVTDVGNFSHLNTTLDIPSLDVEPLAGTLFFDDHPMQSRWLQM